ncbi:Na+/Ca+ antiporter, CaCA family [Chloroherpeton thalassium ATCC 35110]|uniref:Na+/Ca+ antiporter, CaCA family n=1 Tax=Chloroherpeton thalassium (strain ATCC 35110 / GB-78) TaxID=517418 RepID=B3QZ22_CHLT3|nr:calcium/sodium antiporter [Chloroherpeton thalassium]ACF13715.1 Na+/Ca+ antiporter, CaCA family [Chloroherpeton thalassium ATCC 35110]
MDFSAILLLVGGFVLLVFGAEVLVRGASRLAVMFGISPLVIGLTVVSFGTSSPEIAVSVQSSFAGQADLALGNVVGSNIANILLVLGASAIAAPLTVSIQLVRLDVPLMIGVSILLLLLGLDGNLSLIDGVVLFLGVVGYTSFLVIQSRKQSKAEQEAANEEYGIDEQESAMQRWLINPGFIVIGLVMLVFGSDLLVDGAIIIAKAFGVSEFVIGLTIVAVGTSLPELATSVVASLRGERDIAVGNAVGSNLFNILLVLGVSSIIAPGGLTVTDAAIHFDIPIMIGVALLCMPIFFNGIVARWEGLFFLVLYASYVMELYFSTTSHPLFPLYNEFLMKGLLPVTTLLLIFVTVRALRLMRQKASQKST